MDEIKQNTNNKMQNSLEALKSDLSKIRTGRAHTGILDHLTVDYYGSQTAFNQVAGVTLGDATTINIQPYEKTMIAAVEKVIRESDLGLNPATSGDLIRVPMPPLTEERRRDLAKQAKAEAEDAKVGIRNERKYANNEIKALDISEDLKKNLEVDIQALTDKHIQKIDQIFSNKEAEIMKV